MAHSLKLHIDDSTYDKQFVLVTDLSEWDPMLSIQDRILQIFPPFGDCYVKVPLPENQATSISAIHLKLSKKLVDLPDGLYRFHYSVAPNTKVFQEYSHFRVAGLMNEVLSQMASIDADAPALMDACGNIQLTKERTSLLHIWMNLQSIEAIGKFSHLHSRASDLYMETTNLFQKLTQKRLC